ncbi:HAMP domain-containing sensor histidine kinase [Geitlerinema splendidum]|nr:HAMP domain-containing sensor histidine kinase [Geitlerinema splendidum]
MLMPASSEFVALCRSQVSLLTEGLGASLSVVYLTEELVEDVPTQLVPIVAHPEVARNWQPERSRTFLPETSGSQPDNLAWHQRALLPNQPKAGRTDPQPAWTAEATLMHQRQLVFPLMHESIVMGLLVTGRDDRAWNQGEKEQIQQIADSIALACVLDQRAQWLQEEEQHSRQRIAQQHDILDNLLHQFRNPLTAVRTFGKLLVKRLNQSDRNYQIAESIVQQSDRLQDLLQQFDRAIEIVEVDKESVIVDSIDVQSRPQALLPAANALGQNTLPLEACDIRQLLLPLIHSAEAIAQDKQQTLNARLTHPLPLVQANPQALREVLSNILDNAIKYTPPGGCVYLETNEQTPATLCIQISDTGPGIPAQDLEHIFERHYRGVQAETPIPGTGLGLAIAKDLIEQMQGKIQVLSPAVHPQILNRGTTFIVCLQHAAVR